MRAALSCPGGTAEHDVVLRVAVHEAEGMTHFVHGNGLDLRQQCLAFPSPSHRLDLARNAAGLEVWSSHRPAPRDRRHDDRHTIDPEHQTLAVGPASGVRHTSIVAVQTLGPHDGDVPESEGESVGIDDERERMAVPIP